jgi:hypothetical protein
LAEGPSSKPLSARISEEAEARQEANMDAGIDGVQYRELAARLPLWVRATGAIFFVGAAMLFARLIWEETVWTWERGPQMVGFSLAHGSGAVLLLFPVLLFVWTIVVLALSVWSLIRRRQVSRTQWAGIGVSVLLLLLGSLPEGFWQRAFISRMAASQHSGDLLFYAACRGDLGTVQGLLTRGVPVNGTDRAYWKTALHCAASGGDTRILRYLVAKGANVNAVDRAGDSPLELAISNHQDAATKLLVELGAKRIQGSEEHKQKAIHDQVQEDIESLRNR